MRLVVARKGPLLLAVAALLAGLAGCADDAANPEPDGASGSSGMSGGTVTWCEARAVLEAKCQLCHASKPVHGAPFPLVSYADTQVREAGVLRYTRMHLMVSQGLMPPERAESVTPEPLTSSEKAVLLTWIEEGAAPAGGEDCP